MQLTVDKTEKAVGDSDPEDTDENDQEAKAKALADQEVINILNIIIAAVVHTCIYFFSIFINFAKKFQFNRSLIFLSFFVIWQFAHNLTILVNTCHTHTSLLKIVAFSISFIFAD